MHVVAIIYIAAYSQSQLCNWLQRDVANFVNYHGLSDTAMGALHEMGLSVGMDTFYRGVCSSSETHKTRIDKLVTQAIKEKEMIVIIMDDYTNIHVRRRQDAVQQNNISHMATVLMRIFDLPVIPLCDVPSNVPGGGDINLLENAFDHSMPILFTSFATTAPVHVLQHFFDHHTERLRLTSRMYGEDNDIRQMRGVQNAHLIDCVQQPLKSYTNYREAAQVYLTTPLQEYLQHYNVIIPGDWPSQFFQRQLAYNELPDSLFRHTIPTMGPLHVSLNGQENVVLKFIDFFKSFYHHLFGNQLAKKPKPWRITLMLELLYGGLTLFRQPVLAPLQWFKVARDSCDVTHSLKQASIHTSHVHASKSCTKYSLHLMQSTSTH